MSEDGLGDLDSIRRKDKLNCVGERVLANHVSDAQWLCKDNTASVRDRSSSSFPLSLHSSWIAFLGETGTDGAC